MKYGTSGFRDDAKKIINISFKIGVIVAYLTVTENDHFGIMITASHNKYLDNGVKIVDRNGNMIKRDYEIILEKYINNEYEIMQIREYFSPKKIFIGHDTRISYFEIQDEIIKGIKSITEHIQIINLGFVTTPQHHFLVKYNNSNPDFYINKFNSLSLFDFNFDDLVIDCANGIGFITLSKLKEFWNLNFELVNTKVYKYHLLNFESGSDYVINDRQLPYDNNLSDKIGCSLDGDADRFIFYYVDDKINILDGDYIALLYLIAVTKNINDEFTIGYIHTPYTNKAIIDYIKKLDSEINIVCTATGVKNLHHEALKYDISVYFESNGHGTILINNDRLIENSFFKHITLLNNEVVGDGISGIFCVKYFLEHLNMTFPDWFNTVKKNNFLLYKKEVPDKNIFVTNKNGDRLLEPANLQYGLDKLMEEYNCFCFIRPSGTENVIRIYIESNNYLEDLKEKIDILIYNLKDNYI
jgi:phosphoacetylglucosamine mutase